MAKQYERVADDLRQRIESREYSPGERIPTEARLTEQYKVSPPTIRQAVGVLEAEGLVERQHGRGTFVRKPRRKVRRTTDRYQWEKDRVRLGEDERRNSGTTEHDTGVDVQELEFFAKYSTVSASESLGQAFNVAPGTKLLHRSYRTRLRAEDAPLSLIDSYLVFDKASANPALLSDENEPWPGGTQHQLSTIGIEVDRVIEEVVARPPTVFEAEQLEIGAGTSVMALRKFSIDTNGDVVEVSDVILPGDRTVAVYTTHLKNWGD
ncbi:GntR family transcriptional regulator [Prauserella cavernicola]|uniref:GntR family transcriptional regulator n=1 Tax=Prauserella cavernicola TaxID=2800127 RepID=A0A934V5F1_9PSEU|nr:GntR family transcriptional regulator [Prauserella cavernicola]MBK1784543.1 GntR family transcriptional regulator [Prauserella cavernicola]